MDKRKKRNKELYHNFSLQLLNRYFKSESFKALQQRVNQELSNGSSKNDQVTKWENIKNELVREYSKCWIALQNPSVIRTLNVVGLDERDKSSLIAAMVEVGNREEGSPDKNLNIAIDELKQNAKFHYLRPER